MNVSSATASNAGATTPGILINNEMSTSSQQAGTSASASNMAKLRRESIAHSQGMGGVSWGSLTIGSWLRDEVMIHTHMSQAHSGHGSGTPQHTYSGSGGHATGGSNTGNLAGGTSFSPPGAASAYLPNLEKQYCKDYSCCGLLLPGLHDLLRHYEEAHISTSPGTINTHASSMANIPTNVSQMGGMPGATGPAQMASNNALKKQRMAAMYQQQLQQQTQGQQQQRQQPHMQFQQRQSLQDPQLSQQQPQQQQQLHQSHQSPQHHHQQQQTSHHQMSQSTQQGLPHQQSSPHLPHPLADQQQHHSIQYQQFAKQQQQQQQHPQQQHNNHLQQQMHNQMFNQAMQQQLHGGPHNAGSNTTSNVQQLHLNGNLVDAVSTNEVFLQTGAGQTGKRGPMANAGVGGGGFQATPGSQGTTNSAKMQGGFNNYSLNMQPLAKQGLDASALQQFQSQQQQQQQHPQGQQHHQQTGIQQHQLQQHQRQNALLQQQQQQQQLLQHQQQQQQQRLMGNNSNAAMNRQRFTSQVGSVGAGIDLDFMDADIIDDLHDGSAIMGAAPPLSADLAKAWKQVDSGPTAKMSTHHRTKLGNGQDSEDSSMSDDDEEEEVVATTVPITAVNKRKQQPGFIDDPARRLYVMDHEEHKPFKCPVIGCDKTYKNQNGLKYHKLHGHQNQKLHENPDGTFSIIDPESNEPYPDGLGLEKDKPYRCEVCGKRYKNLNGLKYHRGHSTH
ncbi:LAME_0E07580g1_1 [Lachancea meyersii CBS 8951]|uniref:LAME_0E07580g1_1 n=1 Tax=Lachancea meyersii CBS 8951 TaxID=1266667 RepID=A0A1G4JIF5_9SACH|nr:LAME_0E07580g1_1 [Lachancea meyersii CBS 8951]